MTYEKEFYCQFCGKSFFAKTNGRKYCCRECMKKSWAKEKEAKAAEETAVRKTKKREKMTLAEVCRAASEAGMSYGQYVSTMLPK